MGELDLHQEKLRRAKAAIETFSSDTSVCHATTAWGLIELRNFIDQHVTNHLGKVMLAGQSLSTKEIGR